MRVRDPLHLLAAVILSLSLTACSLTASHGSVAGLGNEALPTIQRPLGESSSPIKHIVIVVQENRSFDNIFASYPGAESSTFGVEHDGTKIPLRPVTYRGFSGDLGHSLPNAITDWDKGKMDGFDLVPTSGSSPAGNLPYAYLERSQIAPYWSMAHQYTLADRMFPTEWGASFTAHLDLITGTSLLSPGIAEADNPSASPWGCDAPAGTLTDIWNSSRTWDYDGGPFPCFTQFNTIATPLDAAGLSWKYYAPKIGNENSSGDLWTAFDSISAVRYGPDWKNIDNPQTNVLSDAANDSLPNVSWVIPDLVDSDHAGIDSDTGPSWVAAVVNMIGKSKEWNSTAIIVLWDDWGGWYDNVPPPQPDFVGLGIRVPCIIISPYAKAHYVSHTQYEFGSILKFTEEIFGLPSLGTSDVRANSLADSFDFTRPPRRFKLIAAPYPASHFLKERPSMKVPDNE